MKFVTLVIISLLAMSAPVFAQQIPPPSGPVTFCGAQALPAATSFQSSVDGSVPAPLTMDAAVASGCPVGSTHSFKLPASLFTVGTHTVIVRSTNTFGTTVGPAYSVTVGIAPGAFTVNAVIPG